VTELLDVHTGPSYVLARGVVAPRVNRCVALGGGVSNVVLLIETDSRRVVVKQALGRLRVADLWEAPVGRIVTEARALRFAAHVLTGEVPEVLDVDPAAHAMTIAAAPAEWVSWKDRLLNGTIEVDIADRLGVALAALHNAPTDSADWLDQPAAFRALRVDPYHHAVAARMPNVARPIRELAAEMAVQRCCFVHGDYSPKNVLVGDESLWLIDFEVAHLGDPTFDVAFLLNHLLLKAVRRPAWLPLYRRCANEFLNSYAGRSAYATLASGRYLVRHLGCLLLARAVGKSPAEYLDAHSREVATELGTAALLEDVDTVDQLWTRLATLNPP